MQCHIALFLAFSSLMSCYATQSNVQKLGTSNADFALTFYKTVDGTNAATENIFFSPISISTAFAMVHLGAVGTTKTQMDTIFNFNAVSGVGNIHDIFKELNDMLYSGGNNYTLRSANKLFGRMNYTFKSDYLNSVQTKYGAPLMEMDFINKASESKEYINDWVANKTEQKIKDLIPDGAITPATVLVLVNAIYYKGFWGRPFDKKDTKKDIFYQTTTTGFKDVDFMYRQASYKYAVDSALGVKALELPYIGNLSFIVLLPDAVDGLDKTETGIDVSSFNTLIGKMTYQEVKVWLPKFTLEDVRLDLKKLLTTMGLTTLFSTAEVDLSGIGGSKGDLVVSDAFHEAFIKLDEEGTEAAAATAIIIKETAVDPNAQKPIEFKADHPFMFFIRDQDTGSILFMGRLRSFTGTAETLSAGTPSGAAVCIQNLTFVAFMALLISIVI